MNRERIKALADQCMCHPVSRGIDDIEAAGGAIKELLEHVESLERDAARYRWLRDQHWVESEATFRLCLSDVEYLNQYHDALDYTIDAAIGESK